jgi:hypothetical protein
MNSIVFLLATASILIFLVASPLTLSHAVSSESVNIFPQGSKPYGLTQEQHIQNFWKWVISLPEDQNPWDDPSGKNCANGQVGTNSSVFYLSGNGGGTSERVCTVPAGKGLLIPVMVVEISDKEYPGATVDDLASSAKQDQDSVNSLYLKIDDKEYGYDELVKYRTNTGPFNVVFPDNPAFGVLEGGPSKTVADGFYILTEPISKGNHTVHYKSSLLCLDPDCAEPNFGQDIKYNIIAK